MTDWSHILDTRTGKVMWAFPVKTGMKPKDMPADARSAIEQRSDSLPDVVFRGGAFHSVTWRPAPGWPEPEYSEIQAGDWIAEVGMGLRPIPGKGVVRVTSNIHFTS